MALPIDLDKKIRLTEGEKFIELPMKNFLRLFMVYINRLLPDYYDAKQSNNIKDFFTYMEEILETKDKDVLL